MTHVAAVASYLKSAGELPVNVRFVIEGEEEIGSENLGKFLQKYQHMLPADFIVLSDTANFDTGIPALTYQLRGICTIDVTVQTIAQPVHSGMWGGPVPDPVQILCSLIASLQGKKGEIDVPGLYKQVAKTPAKQLQRIRKLPFNEAKFKREAGLMKGMKLAGERGFSVYEQLWTRPSLTVIAFDARPIKGSSNQIIDHVTARLSLRTVPNMDGATAGKAIVKKLLANRPYGATVKAEIVGTTPVVDDRPRGAGVRGRAPRAEGRLRQGDGDDRGGRLDRLRRSVRRSARWRPLHPDGRRGPAVQRALGEREPAPRGLGEVDEVGDLHVRRAVARGEEAARERRQGARERREEARGQALSRAGAAAAGRPLAQSGR